MAKKKAKTVRGTAAPTFAERVAILNQHARRFVDDPDADGYHVDLEVACRKVLAKHPLTEREILFVEIMTGLFDYEKSTKDLVWITPRRAARLAGYKSSAMGTLLMKREHIRAALGLFLSETIGLKFMSAYVDPDEVLKTYKVAKRDTDGD